MMDDFLRVGVGASVISPAGLPLRGAGEMHGRDSPAPTRLRLVTHSPCGREGGGRKRACDRRASRSDDPARLAKTASAAFAHKIAPNRRGASRSKKSL